MKKIINLKSMTAKTILLIILCSAILIMIALPVFQSITYNTFYPYMVEYTTQRMSDSAILMSTFLADANTTFRIFDFVHNLNYSEDAEKYIKEVTAPMVTSFQTDETNSYTCTSYPAIYIEGSGIYCDPAIEAEAASFFESEWFQQYKTDRFGYNLYPITIYDDTAEDKQPEYFGYITSSFIDRESQTPCYSILLTKYSELLPLWDSIFELGISDYAFFNYDYDVLYQQGDLSALDLSWFKDNPSSNLQHLVVMHKENDEIYCSVLVSYQNEGLHFIMRVPQNIFSDLFGRISLVVEFIMITLIAILIFVIVIILRQIFKRLTRLSEKMAVVQDGNYNVKLDDSSEDEIGQLASSFNIMTSKIQDNVNQLIEKEKREKMLQYNLMVSALNPHFIYNTLNTSTRLAELGRTEDVITVNDALINCMKDNLKMKNFQAYDTVANEIDILDQYIIIQNFLCDNTISLECHVSDEDMQLKIPNFLLQPLVENSIIHGILMNIDENGNMIEGNIKIYVKQSYERIKIRLCDNGIGMSQETIQQYFYDDENVILNEQAHIEHIGVLNTRTRLSYLYNDNYSLNVTSNRGSGTEIIIDIPMN